MSDPRWQDNKPPWVAFPELGIGDWPARQGAAEDWGHSHFKPFWMQLSDDERHSFMLHWQASAEWREALPVIFDDDPEFDADADYEESQRFLAQRRVAEATKPKGFWARLFRR